MRRLGDPAGKEILLGLEPRLDDPGRHSGAGGFGQLELDRALCLPLHDHGPGQDLVPVGDVPDPQIHQVAAPQLAVDGEIEHSQIPNLMGILQMDSDGSDVLRLQGRFLADQFSLVPRRIPAGFFGLRIHEILLLREWTFSLRPSFVLAGCYQAFRLQEDMK